MINDRQGILIVMLSIADGTIAIVMSDDCGVITAMSSSLELWKLNLNDLSQHKVCDGQLSDEYPILCSHLAVMDTFALLLFDNSHHCSINI